MKKKPPEMEIKAAWRPCAAGLKEALISISGTVSFSWSLSRVPFNPPIYDSYNSGLHEYCTTCQRRSVALKSNWCSRKLKDSNKRREGSWRADNWEWWPKEGGYHITDFGHNCGCFSPHSIIQSKSWLLKWRLCLIAIIRGWILRRLLSFHMKYSII